MKVLEERELRIMFETIQKEHPDKDDTFYKIFLSIEVLRLMIDNEWVNQILFNEHPNRDRINNDGFRYFRSDNNGFQWQERIYRFSERVYNLRHVPNIQNVIDDIKSGNLVSRFAELEVGAHLYSRGIEFEYVLPTNLKGKDFDIVITEPLNINCEVKHKIESTKLSKSTITKAISRSNKQIPKDKPAIIFLKIPENWILEKGIVEILNSSFEPIFKRNSNHLMGIMLRWEQRNPNDDGMFFWMYRFFRNEYFSLSNEQKQFLQLITSERKNWFSFMDIIESENSR